MTEQAAASKNKNTDRRLFTVVVYEFLGAAGRHSVSFRIDLAHGGSLFSDGGEDRIVTMRGGEDVYVPRGYILREVSKRMLDCPEWREPEATDAGASASAHPEPPA